MTFDQQEEAMSAVTPQGVYKAISAAMATLASQGISKDRKNEQQGYKFRGIDDVYNALSSALVGAGLVILPSFKNRQVVERTTAKGNALFYVTVEGTFTFVCVADGSTHTAGPFFGEAMDSADKATNKAMSASYKYMAMEVFCIPTEGDNDADATTHEIKSRPKVDPTEAPRGSAREVTTDAFNAMEPSEQASIRSKADFIADTFAAKGIVEAYNVYADMNLDTEQKLALSACMDSGLRNQLKGEGNRRREHERKAA